MDKYIDKAIELIMEKGPKIALAIVVLLVGLWLINVLLKSISKMMDKRQVDPSLRPFLRTLINITFKVLLLISVMGMIGIEMTSFIALLGAIGLAIGMALSGTLQNLAGGVVILLFRPFKVGDFIEAQGYSGTVKEIQIFNTILTALDNRIIIIPNAPLSSGSMVNYTALPIRRIDHTFGIGYGDDIDKARKVMQKVMSEHPKVLQDKENFIAVKELGDSSVNFTFRAWVNTPDYWEVYFDLPELIKKNFDQEGISIPFPQTDVHLHKVN